MKYWNWALRLGTFLGLCVSACFTGAACAQGAEPSGEVVQGADRLTEITVTARRREERLQDVPISMTAIRGDSIERSTLTSLSDIQTLVPSVTVNPSLAYASYQIRGVGTQSYDTGVEASVGVVVDGVVDGNTRSLAINSLSDIERIEVLRGPQGTLYGKNSSAGVIQVITRQPVLGKWEVDGRVNYGTDNETVTNLAVNIPLAATLAGRITAYYQGRDGFINNYDGAKLGANFDKGARAKVLWQPTSNLDVTFSGYDSRNDGAIGYYTLRSYGITTGPGSFRDLDSALGIAPSPTNLQSAVYDGGHAYWWTKNHGAAIEAVYILGDFTLTSITGWRAWDLGSHFPVGAVPLPLFPVNDGSGYHTDQYTQEFRIQSPIGPLTYIAGLYFYEYDLKANQLQGGTLGAPLPPGEFLSPSNGLSHFINGNLSYATFGDATYNLASWWRIFAGLRYTNDAVKSSLSFAPVTGFIPLGPTTPIAGKATADNVSYRVGPQFDVAQDVDVYASISTGYKGPIAATPGGVLHSVKPETVTAHEIGLKTLLMGRRLMFDLAIYTSKFRDFQTSIYDTSVTPPANRLANADSLNSRGVELDSRFKPTSDLTLSATAAYNYTEYGQIYVNCYPLQPVGSSPDNGNCAPIPGSPSQTWSNLRGLPLAQTPKLSFSLAADYKTPLSSSLQFDADLRYSWRGASRSSPNDPNTTQSSYGVLNANVGIGTTSDAWRVGAYVRNLFAQRFASFIGPTAFDPGGYWQNPTTASQRTAGVTVTFSY